MWKQKVDLYCRRIGLQREVMVVMKVVIVQMMVVMVVVMMVG